MNSDYAPPEFADMEGFVPVGEEPPTVREPESYFYLEVPDDALAPDIKAGDLALVRRQDALEPGQLGLVCIGGADAALRVWPVEGGDVRVYGRVVETKRRW